MPEPTKGQSGWWKVEVAMIVRASSEDGAINQAASALRHGYESAAGIYPVGTFRARQHRDARTDRLDRDYPDA